MEISIDEIKLILNNQFSIRDALKTKKSSTVIPYFLIMKKLNIII